LPSDVSFSVLHTTALRTVRTSEPDHSHYQLTLFSSSSLRGTRGTPKQFSSFSVRSLMRSCRRYSMPVSTEAHCQLGNVCCGCAQSAPRSFVGTRPPTGPDLLKAISCVEWAIVVLDRHVGNDVWNEVTTILVMWPGD